MKDKRMFSNSVTNTDRFLNMPATTKYLYFALGMCADDDGFVGNPQSETRKCGCSSDDLKLLLTKGYLIAFPDSDIVLIRHWKICNYVRADRYTPTVFQNEMEQVDRDERTGEYVPLRPIVTQEELPAPKKKREKKPKPVPKEEDLDSPVYIYIPLNTGEMFPITRKDVESWAEAYQAVDVEQELKVIRSWCDANPKRRKTVRGVKRFVNDWLAKTQNSGGVYRNGGLRTQTATKEKDPIAGLTREQFEEVFSRTR